jgi:hypothetical protein
MPFVRQKATSLLLLLAVLATSALAVAAPRDKAAQKKIEEAIYTNFLNTDFDGAEGLLLGTIRACEDKCSPGLVAKAWMYVGVIRGSGRNDLNGAQEAFTTAMGIDPNVALDNEIATDPVKATFAKVKGGGAAASAPTSSASGASGSFTCAPTPTEIETRRPFPLQCEADDKVASVKIHYKTSNGGWQSLKMALQDGSFRATMPCSATASPGSFKYYVEGADADGNDVVAFGSEDAPKSVDVVAETTADPPAYPDQQPPARCAVGEGGATAPAAGGACGAWGEPCGADDCCTEGLTCNAGTCENPSEAAKSRRKGDFPKNWVGLHFAFDVATVSSDAACGDQARHSDNIVCFAGNQTYSGVPATAAQGKIDGGFTFATMRVMGSYERIFGSLGLEGRIGFAFNGGRTPAGGSAFLPIHLEGRAKWWLRGPNAMNSPGFRPWLHVGGGMAQIDARVNTDIIDCGTGQTNPRFNDCRSDNAHDAQAADGGVRKTVEATKQLGQEFATIGGGVMYAVARNHGAVLNLNLVVPFPSVAFVFEPSIGYEFGF